jgi:hypothetical protein
VLCADASRAHVRCRYEWVPFPFPNGVFNDRWRDVLCGIFSAPLP